MIVERMRLEDVDQISVLHIENLRTHFNGTSGKKLLNCYYKAVVKENGACGFVAKEAQEVVGFVCGIWDENLLQKKLILSQFFRLAFWGAVQVILNPHLLVRFIQKMNNHGDKQDNVNGYELRPIVVKKDYRGRGVSDLLVLTLLKDAAARGYVKVHLFTEEDNRRAQRFYEKVGFSQRNICSKPTGNYYLYEINSTQEV